MPTYGFMTLPVLNSILDRYEAYRNPLTGGRPRFIVAGGGEPTMNPDAVALLAAVKARGFHVTLITNAGRIEKIDAPGILRQVDELLISFWGIEAREYRAAMKLDFNRSLANVRTLVRLSRDAGIPLAVQWLRTEAMTSTAESIRAFWYAEGIEDVRGGDVIWNRAGELQVSDARIEASEALLPNFARAVWCADLYLSDAYAWDGSLKLCCCSYFSSRSPALISTREMSLEAIENAKAEVLERKDRAECQNCRLPRRLRAQQLLGSSLDCVPTNHLEALVY